MIDEDELYKNNVDLYAIYDFEFFIWNHLDSQVFVLSSRFLEFKIFKQP